MIYILDAYNVIHKIRSLERALDKDLRAARESLIGLCSRFAASRGDISKIILVFDGKSEFWDLPQANTPKIQLIFSDTGEDADERIILVLEDLSKNAEKCVVSDDNFVRNQARAHQTRVMPVAEFNALMQHTGQKGGTKNAGSPAFSLSQKLADEITRDYKKKLGLGCFLFMLLNFLVFPVSARAADYSYNQGKSRVSFTLRHLGLVTVEGHFKTFSGSFRFDPKSPENSSVNILIQPASVASGSAHRDADLRSENFFAAEKYPEIQFESKKSIVLGTNHFNVEGDLTIHGITRAVVFETELLTPPGKIKTGQPVSFRSKTFIKRKDFHLGTGNWLDPILFITDETLKISLEVEGIPQAPSNQNKPEPGIQTS